MSRISALLIVVIITMILAGIYGFRSDETVDISHMAAESPAQNIINNSSQVSALSQEAEYPLPVIKLQMLISEGIKDEANHHLFSTSADIKSMPTNDKTITKIQTLRERLDKLK